MAVEKTINARKMRKKLKTRAENNEAGRQYYVDNMNNVFHYEWLAGLSSFKAIIFSSLKVGFPITLSFGKNAWALYPFIIFRKGARFPNIQTTIVHERIHILQQRDILLFISLPLLAILIAIEKLYGIPMYLVSPFLWFIPQFLYLVEALCKLPKYKTWEMAKRNTSFERECISHCTNYLYLKERKTFETRKFI